MTNQTRIQVPQRLRRAHPYVVATRDAAIGLRAAEDGRISIGPRAGLVHVVLSRELLRLALLLVQGVLDEATRRGWSVERYDKPAYGRRAGIALGIGDHRYPIEIHEITETIEFTDAEIEAWRSGGWSIERREGKLPPPQLKRKRGTGHLKLMLPNGYGGGRASWSGGPRGSLARKLPSVFDAIEVRAADDDRAAAEAAVRAEEWRREQAAREDRARAVRIERSRAERLVAEVQAWRRSAEIDDYVRELRTRLPALPTGERERVSAWADWAADWAERSDAVRHTALIAGLDEAADTHA